MAFSVLLLIIKAWFLSQKSSYYSVISWKSSKDFLPPFICKLTAKPKDK